MSCRCGWRTHAIPVARSRRRHHRAPSAKQRSMGRGAGGVQSAQSTGPPAGARHRRPAAARPAGTRHRATTRPARRGSRKRQMRRLRRCARQGRHRAAAPVQSRRSGGARGGAVRDLSRFSPRFDRIPGKHLIQFLTKKMQDFRNFVLHNCIRKFQVDAEQDYSSFKSPMSRTRKLQQS